MNSSSITTWDPFRELGQIQNRIANLLTSSETGSRLTPPEADWAPAVDIAEDDHSYTITADLPDVKKEDVSVKVEEGILILSGKRETEIEEEDKEKKYHRVERSYGSYLRRFELPDTVDAEAVAAKFREGVLTISLPKVPAVEPKQVEVTVD